MPASVAGTLARADARSGDPVAIAEYLGEDDQFDRSITNFAKRHADQNERDYQALLRRSDPDGCRHSKTPKRRPVASVQFGRESGAVAPTRGTVRAICRSRFQSMIGLGSGTPGRSRGTRTRRAAGWTVQRTGVSSNSASPSTPTGIWDASASTTT
jgi:hypothetical protein